MPCLVSYLHASYLDAALAGSPTGWVGPLAGILITLLGNGERMPGLDIRTRRGLSGIPSTAISIHIHMVAVFTEEETTSWTNTSKVLNRYKTRQ